MKRTMLLLILGVKGINAVVGGLFLILFPEGKFMNMPVTVMHGMFSDFFIPGMILFSMGIVSVLAFVAIVLRSSIDWFITFAVLFGFVIWFSVQIMILKEINLLHIVFGIPILIGFWTAYPLIPIEKSKIFKEIYF